MAKKARKARGVAAASKDLASRKQADWCSRGSRMEFDFPFAIGVASDGAQGIQHSQLVHMEYG